VASRKEQKERLRQERLEREQAEAAAAARRKRLGYAVAGVLVLAVVVALAVIALAGGGSDKQTGTSASGWGSSPPLPKRKETDLSVAAKTAGCVLQHPKSQGRGHTTSHVSYKTQPPTSGSHNPQWTHDGAFLKDPGTEHLVHDLEHGRVIIWFKPNVPATVRGSLKKLFDEDNKLTVLTPSGRPMPYQVAATAWTQLLGCPKYNDKVPDAIRAFRDAYRLKGPEYFPNAE
jgi:hypothetical protein